jgi:hypothetical protein
MVRDVNPLDRRWLAAGALAAALVSAPELAAQPAGDRRAAELMEQGDWVRAAEALRALVAQKPTATRLFNLAQSERNLGRLVQSKRRFQAALAAAKSERLPAVASAAEQAIAGLEPRIARIEIAIAREIDGTVVRLEGRQIELGPERTLEVDPGARRLHVSAPGHRAFERELTLREGERLRVDVTLEPTRAAESSPTREQPPPGASELPPTPALVLGGAGIAALAGGVVFHFVADSKYDEAASACRDDGSRYVCPEGLEHDARHRELRDDADGAAALRNVLLVAGTGALVAGGLWWALSPRERGSPEVGVSVTPTTAAARLRVPLF